jgi:deoxyribose-phosphate aldolase
MGGTALQENPMAKMAGSAAADQALARRALALLDFTDLSDTASEASAAQLCDAASGPAGQVAALCVWPQMVGFCKRRLGKSSIALATVVNFPGGTQRLDRVLDDVEEALSDGADEIDLVMPYKAFLKGDEMRATEMIGAVRDALGDAHVLKVILETGAYGTPDQIAAASRLAIAAGADFIKTSTGKSAVSATPGAVHIMLGVIKDSGEAVGIKPSGGIRTLADAGRYLALADEIMGPKWATAKTFRFGASGLHAALVAAIVDSGTAGSAKSGY